MKKIKILLVLTAIVLLSCTKSEDETPIIQDPNSNNSGTPNPYAGYDIYASGKQGSGAVLWKNGKILYSDPVDYSFFRTGGFCIAGNDIYEGAEKNYRNLAGIDNLDYNRGGCVLKNGSILFNDTGAYSSVRDVVVSGNDVYYLVSSSAIRATSIDSSRPKLYKNGQVLYNLFDLASNNNNGFKVFSLQIVNNNVYVGVQYGNGRTGYFKNGVYTQIIPPNNNEYRSSELLYVAPNEDVYLKLNVETRTGLSFPQIINNNFKIFKNGTELSGFQTSINKTYAYFMKVVGSDVYLIGYDDQKNAIWKNGIRTYLPEDNTINNGLRDEIYDLNVIDNKIFIAGKIQSVISGLNFSIPYPQVWELTNTNTNIVAHEVEVSTKIYGSEYYQISKLFVLKK